MDSEDTEIISAVPDSAGVPFAGLASPPALPEPAREFTREARLAARAAMISSYRACRPHFAPVRARSTPDGLEFADPEPARPATRDALSALADSWEAKARAEVRATYRTALAPPAAAASPDVPPQPGTRLLPAPPPERAAAPRLARLRLRRDNG